MHYTLRNRSLKFNSSNLKVIYKELKIIRRRSETVMCFVDCRQRVWGVYVTQYERPNYCVRNEYYRKLN